MYCTRCRQKTEDKGSDFVATRNNKLRKTAECAGCGARKSQFVAEYHGGALSAEDKAEAGHWSRFAGSAYEPVESRDQFLQDKGIQGWEQDRDFADPHTAVYRNPETGKAVVAFRGTHEAKDLVADAHILAGTFNKSGQYKAWDKTLKGVVGKYGHENVERLTGHSLGGKGALALGSEHQIPSESFNPGSSPLELQKGIVQNLRCKIYPESCRFWKTKQRNWHVAGDPISLGLQGSPYKNKVIMPSGANVHTIGNWYDL